MPNHQSSMAQRVAEAASADQLKRTGSAPRSATATLNGDTLVITLQGALTPAEQALAASADGTAQVQDYHRLLFAAACDGLRQSIHDITGIEVRCASAEVETTTGAVIHTFANGTMVQVFLLAQPLPAEAWNAGQP